MVYIRLFRQFAAVLAALFIFEAKTYANLPDSRDLVAATIVLEAGGEGEMGMLAVANVIQNRSVLRNLSYEKVVTQPKQFSAMNSGRYRWLVSKAKRSSAWSYAYSLARKMESGMLDDVTGGADHYHADWMLPRWASSMRQTVAIGGHVFYSSKVAQRRLFVAKSA